MNGAMSEAISGTLNETLSETVDRTMAEPETTSNRPPTLQGVHTLLLQ
jgi:hypothetical protein